jgi:hypothetical protein
VIQLEVGQAVLLRMRAAEALAARVAAVEGATAELVLLTPPLRPPANGAVVAVEATSRRGIVRREARITGHDGRGSVRVDLAGDATETVQRRDFVRVDAVVPVTILDGGSGPERKVLTRNVSGNGLLLSGAISLNDGDTAWVAIDLEDGTPPIEVLVTVVRVDRDGTRAVRIASISGRDEQRLVRFSFARERRARMVRDL